RLRTPPLFPSTTLFRSAVEAAGDVDAEIRDVLDRWDAVLTRLGEDPMSCAADVEWVAKLRVLEGMRRRDGIGWENPRLAALDLQDRKSTRLNSSHVKIS